MKRVANMKPAARMAEIERPAEKSSGGAPDPLPEVLPAGTRFNLGNGEWEFLVTARRVPGADAPGWYSGMARHLLGITDEAHVKATSIDWSSLPPSDPAEAANGGSETAREYWENIAARVVLNHDGSRAIDDPGLIQRVVESAFNRGDAAGRASLAKQNSELQKRLDGQIQDAIGAIAFAQKLKTEIEAYERFVEWVSRLDDVRLIDQRLAELKRELGKGP